MQGATAALAARWAGDEGPARDGALTLDPTRHVDVLGLASAALFSAGWSRPPTLEGPAFRSRALGTLTCVLAPVVALLAVAAALLALRPAVLGWLGGNAGIVASTVLLVTFELGVRGAVLALLPLPQTTGGAWFLLSRATEGLQTRPAARWAGAVVTLALLAVGPGDVWLRGAADWYRGLLGF